MPTLNRPFLLRLAITAIIAWLFFGYICIPALINGDSMYPTYKNRAFLFCWRPRYWFAQPNRGDVVMLRIAGRKVMLLKRVIALPGDTVAFEQGILLINGEEPNVPGKNLRMRLGTGAAHRPARTAYAVGDNRAMPIDEHEFGEIAISRIAGAPVWPPSPPP